MGGTTVDDVETLIARARHGEGDSELAGLVQVLDALSRGGLSYALDWHELHVFDQAAAAGRTLGAERVADLLVDAADIARSHRGFDLQRAIASFDDRYRPISVDHELRNALRSVRWRPTPRTRPPTSH
jgi:hypothetical protein